MFLESQWFEIRHVLAKNGVEAKQLGILWTTILSDAFYVSFGYAISSTKLVSPRQSTISGTA